MPSHSDVFFDNRLDSQTETFLGTISDCVHLLPELLDDYWCGYGYQETADEIRTLESECDEIHREISGLFSSATVEDLGLRNARIYLNASLILKVYQRLDDIPNVAEQIAEELVTIRPSRIEPHFQRLQEMATCATRTVTVLEDVMSTFARLLCSPDASGTISDEIQTIRTLESSCDNLRNDLIEGVFADEPVDQPLLYREFALLFDRLTDTVEDVTDHIALIAGSEPWIDTEPTLEKQSP